MELDLRIRKLAIISGNRLNFSRGLDLENRFVIVTHWTSSIKSMKEQSFEQVLERIKNI